MKKLFAILAVAGALAACNGNEGENAAKNDSTKTETPKMMDSAAAKMDTAAAKMKSAMDTAAAKMNNAMDTAKKMVEKAKEEVKK